MKKSLKHLKNDINFLYGYYCGLRISSIACGYIKEDGSFDHQRTLNTIRREMENVRIKVQSMENGSTLDKKKIN